MRGIETKHDSRFLKCWFNGWIKKMHEVRMGAISWQLTHQLNCYCCPFCRIESGNLIANCVRKINEIVTMLKHLRDFFWCDCPSLRLTRAAPQSGCHSNLSLCDFALKTAKAEMFSLNLKQSLRRRSPANTKSKTIQQSQTIRRNWSAWNVSTWLVIHHYLHWGLNCDHHPIFKRRVTLITALRYIVETGVLMLQKWNLIGVG